MVYLSFSLLPDLNAEILNTLQPSRWSNYVGGSQKGGQRFEKVKFLQQFIDLIVIGRLFAKLKNKATLSNILITFVNYCRSGYFSCFSLIVSFTLAF